jgi:hypothetical protein
MARPNYHFIYLDKSLSPDWIFIAARRYWEKFRPILIADLDVVALVPAGRTIAITSLSRRDMAPIVDNLIRQRFPRVRYDPLVYDVLEDLQLTLDGRVDYNQRFGIPEDTPTTEATSEATVEIETPPSP